MPRPSTVFSWAASGGAYLAAIPTAIRDLGFVPFSTSVAEWVNQALNDVGDWIDFLAAFHPQDGEIEVGKVTGNGDPDGSGVALLITTDGSSGNGIAIAPQPGEDVVIQTIGAGSTFSVTTLGGSIEANSFAIGDSSVNGYVFSNTPNPRNVFGAGAAPGLSNHRYPYHAANPIELDFQVWPGLGGWMLLTDPAGTGVFSWTIDTNGFVATNSGGNATFTFCAPVPGITGNTDPTETSSTLYEVVGLFSEWGAARDIDPDVKLVQRLKVSPYTETILLTVNAASPNDNGPVNLTPRTHEYYMLMTAGVMLNTWETTPLESLILTIKKYAVE
jgi:hypothetical protein